MFKIQESKIRLGFFIITLFIFSSSGYCQSIIRGNLFFYDSNELARGCNVEMYDTINIGSSNILADQDGNFTVKNVSNDTIDLKFSFVGYRNTIVKNISIDADTINLNKIPLFIDDRIINETGVITKKHWWGVSNRRYDNTIGVEGPFSYKDELFLLG